MVDESWEWCREEHFHFENNKHVRCYKTFHSSFSTFYMTSMSMCSVLLSPMKIRMKAMCIQLWFKHFFGLYFILSNCMKSSGMICHSPRTNPLDFKTLTANCQNVPSAYDGDRHFKEEVKRGSVATDVAVVKTTCAKCLTSSAILFHHWMTH